MRASYEGWHKRVVSTIMEEEVEINDKSSNFNSPSY